MKDIALKTFEYTGINITEDGKRHLGAVEYRKNYVTQKVNNWLHGLNMLCDIARIEPQAEHCCFVSGYKHKLTYIMRTIPNISHKLEKTDDMILKNSYQRSQVVSMSPQANLPFCHYPENKVVWVSQYF